MCPLKGKTWFEGNVIQLNCLIQVQLEKTFSRIMSIYVPAIAFGFCYLLEFTYLKYVLRNQKIFYYT